MTFKSILLEATEYVDGASLAKAILRGQIAGISKKFFNGKEPDIEALDKFLQIVKNNFNKPLQNKVVVLLLNKAKTIDNLKYVNNQIIDTTKSYFDNVNKEEAKKPEVKELFDKFEEIDLTDPFNKTFENKINDLFADYAEMKSDDEYEVIYSTDEEGWEVVVPKTFAAAKYLSSFKGVGKAFWCTAAHAYHFRDYTQHGNKLYIIRNLKKKIFYQADFGYQHFNNQYPSFQDFHNEPVNLNEVLDTIPLKVLDSIKSIKGVSIAKLIKKNIDKSLKSEKIKDWEYKELSKPQLMKILKQYKIDIYVTKSDNNNFVGSEINNSDIEKVKKNVVSMNNILDHTSRKYIEPKGYLITHNDKKYLFVKSIYEIFSSRGIYKNLFDSIIELEENNKYKILSLKSFREDENIPSKIKKILFDIPPKAEKKPNYVSYSTKDYKMYLIKNLAAFRQFVPKEIQSFILKQEVEEKKFKAFKKALKDALKNGKPLQFLYIKKDKRIFLFALNDENYPAITKNEYSLHYAAEGEVTTLFYDKDLKEKIKKNFTDFYNTISGKETKKKNIETYDKLQKSFKDDFIAKSIKSGNKTFFFFPKSEQYYGGHTIASIKNFYMSYKNNYDFSSLVNKGNNSRLIFTPFVYVENNKVYQVSEDEAIYNIYDILKKFNIKKEDIKRQYNNFYFSRREFNDVYSINTNIFDEKQEKENRANNIKQHIQNLSKLNKKILSNDEDDNKD